MRKVGIHLPRAHHPAYRQISSKIRAMKTITQYQPLIFGKMQKRTELREIQRTNILNIVGKCLPVIYVATGIGLMMDTGYMLWDWQFWLVMAPFFVACEAAFLALSHRAVLKRAAMIHAEEKHEETRPSRWSFNAFRPLFARSLRHRRILNYPLVRVN